MHTNMAGTRAVLTSHTYRVLLSSSYFSLFPSCQNLDSINCAALVQKSFKASGNMLSGIIAPFISLFKISKSVTTEEAPTEDAMPERQVVTNDVLLAELDGLREEQIASIARSLKRKLDVRLMATAWVMFAFNHFDRVRALQGMLSLVIDAACLLELSGLGQDHGPPGRSGYGLRTVRACHDAALLRILHCSIALQPLYRKNTPVQILTTGDGFLGDHLHVHRLYQGPQRLIHTKALPWYTGGPFRCRLSVLNLILVHPERAGSPQRDLVFGTLDGARLYGYYRIRHW